MVLPKTCRCGVVYQGLLCIGGLDRAAEGISTALNRTVLIRMVVDGVREGDSWSLCTTVGKA